MVSWTVIFGTATQSNYLASNSFIDAFARHRRTARLPCTTLTLSQVLGIGIVSYMTECQQVMVRNGFYGNNEDEFQHYCESGSLSHEPEEPADPEFKHDPYPHGHLLVGIELAGLHAVDRKFSLSEMSWARDPRFQNLIQATALLLSSTHDRRAAEVEKGTVLDLIQMKISRLLYVPLDEVDVDKAINDYDIDSMIAAELRNWLFASLGRQVSLLKLLSATMAIQRLAEEAEAPVE
ncbi:hypothetical protein PVAG01_03354 [Phlyctema vagabunda]|uniref:Carrier domain-containing protein n=1 Tax=Phlyctema vagabunda TaxID=108571 RepID=A0ABR4PLF3_9HELO